MRNKDCNCKESLFKVDGGAFFGEFHYCLGCGSIWVQTLVKAPEANPNQKLLADQMRDFAKEQLAYKSVTKEDLIKLGYLKPRA